MRLIRSVFRPANDGLSLQFRRCQDIETSSAYLHPVLNETTNSIRTSKIWCNNLSYANYASASAASSALEDRKPQKRVSKSERRTMVENYVNKYREKSEGKFPSPSDIKKNVGGNYYVVRQILQEMIHHSKLSSIEMVCNSKEQSMCTNDTGIRPILKGSDNSSSMISKQSQQSSVSDDTVEPKDVGAQSHHPIKEIESIRNLDYENEVKPEIVVDLVKSDERNAGSHESIEISERRLHELPPQEAEAQKISALWNNLKSYANGIFSMWNRS